MTTDTTISDRLYVDSPLHYCQNVLAEPTASPDEAQPQQDEKLQNVVKALYLYWQAADAYFRS